jgi:hypothetical protein
MVPESRSTVVSMRRLPNWCLTLRPRVVCWSHCPNRRPLPRLNGWLMLLRYVVPVVLLGILAVSVEGTVAKVTGLFG